MQERIGSDLRITEKRTDDHTFRRRPDWTRTGIHPPWKHSPRPDERARPAGEFEQWRCGPLRYQRDGRFAGDSPERRERVFFQRHRILSFLLTLHGWEDPRPVPALDP